MILICTAMIKVKNIRILTKNLQKKFKNFEVINDRARVISICLRYTIVSISYLTSCNYVQHFCVCSVRFFKKLSLIIYYINYCINNLFLFYFDIIIYHYIIQIISK